MIREDGYDSQNGFIHTFLILQAFRKDNILCDIKLETNDGTIVNGHKLILAAASPYFYTKLLNKNQVFIQELDSITLQLIVDFIYTNKITVTEDNVWDLLSASNLLQINGVKDACCYYLKTQLQPNNCLSIKALAESHSCPELLSSSESYIQKHFSEVVLCDEFLSLSSEQIAKLILCDELNVPSNEKVFEFVNRWVNHISDDCKDNLPKLMVQVPLPLTSTTYLKERLEGEPCVEHGLECRDHIVDESICTNLKESIYLKPFNITSKVILVIGGEEPNSNKCTIEWYNSTVNLWDTILEFSKRSEDLFVVMDDQFVYRMSGDDKDCSKRIKSVDILDLSSVSPFWVPTASMLGKRSSFGVAILDNCIYVVGGHYGNRFLNSAEMFDCSTKKWRLISSMSYRRLDPGVGVLDNTLYAIGGHNGRELLKSVECYDPNTDTWEPVADMRRGRIGAAVCALNGVLYAVGGGSRSRSLKSVESFRPSTGVWTPVADMNQCREYAGVAALDGLLYAVGGENVKEARTNSVETYNPDTNTWTMLTASMKISRARAKVFAVHKCFF